MIVTAMMSGEGLVLGGAVVALAWMSWVCISARTKADEKPRRQRPAKIIRA